MNYRDKDDIRESDWMHDALERAEDELRAKQERDDRQAEYGPNLRRRQLAGAPQTATALAQELQAQAVLYGESTRSQSVTPLGSARPPIDHIEAAG